MASNIATGAVHHITLTVADVGRSHAFYEEVLGFKKVADLGPRILAHNGSFLLALTPASSDDAGFDETRVGIDHISLAVESRDELERAITILDGRGVSHGEITDLADFAITVLMFRDPDNIQVELTTSLS